MDRERERDGGEPVKSGGGEEEGEGDGGEGNGGSNSSSGSSNSSSTTIRASYQVTSAFSLVRHWLFRLPRKAFDYLSPQQLTYISQPAHCEEVISYLPTQVCIVILLFSLYIIMSF